MDPVEARHYMKQCIDSGLWVPNSKGGDITGSEGSDTEPIYEEANKEAAAGQGQPTGHNEATDQGEPAGLEDTS
ncbi:hypothetical protein FKM82_017193 [Ascaphus truei]